MMKKSALLILVVLAFFSCKKETAPPLARITVGNLKFSVDPSIQPPFTYYLPINGVKLNAFATLDAANIDTADIKNIQPGRATLKALFCNGDLNFLDAVSVRLCQTNNNEANCGQEVFYREPVPLDAGCEVGLVPSAVDDVRAFVVTKEINVQVKLERLRDIPQGSFEIVLEMEFEVR